MTPIGVTSPFPTLPPLTQKVVVIDVLAQWMNEPGGGEIGAGLFKLRDALTDDLERE